VLLLINNEIIIVFTTVDQEELAHTLAQEIVQRKLAACVQIIRGISSYYVWQGEVQHVQECLLQIKTLRKNYSALQTFLTTHHSYEVPEIIAVSAADVAENYGCWLKKNLMD